MIITPLDADIADSLRWSSSEPLVATVDPVTGLITTKRVGDTTITVEVVINGMSVIKDTCLLTVTDNSVVTKTYTVTYNSNGGSGSIAPQTTNVGTATTIATNTFTRTGHTFKEWNTDATGNGTSYANGINYNGSASMTLYAQWTEDTFNVSGTVEDDKKVVVSEADVKLMKGNKQIGETVKTGPDGNFTILNVPNGTYNLVVSKDGIIVTTIIVISGNDYATGTIMLPSGKTNSIVEVKPNTPQIVVGNLEQQFIKEDRNVVTGGGSVEIKLVAEKKNNTAPNASNITATASSNGKTVGQFIDLSVFKKTTAFNKSATTTKLSELPTIVDLYIPLDKELQGKSDYVMYRYHGDAVNAITTEANADNEKIELVDGGATIKLTTKKFSTYAIAYKDTTSSGGTVGGSEHNFSVIEKLIIDLPSVDDFKNINLPEFEKIEIEYKRLTNDEKLVIDEFLHKKYKAIAKLAEAMRKEVAKPVVIKPTPVIAPTPKPTKNPKTGDETPMSLPITFVTLGLALMALGFYLKGKGKQQAAE